MKKFIYFIYAAICYFIFLATFLYLIGFIENITTFSFAEPFKQFFPKTLDTGDASLSTFPAILVNLLLMALFGVQHSVMARKGFKKKWTKLVPKAIERSTYVLFASLSLIILFYFWQPVKFQIWNFSGSIIGDAFLLLSICGWLILFVSTYLINHFDLFGLRQAYLYARDESHKIGQLDFRTPFFYRLVRHPLYLGFLMIFWFSPVMTLGHLIFAGGMTIYIFIGIYHEERDLMQHFGKTYADYKLKTPKVIPFTK